MPASFVDLRHVDAVLVLDVLMSHLPKMFKVLLGHAVGIIHRLLVIARITQSRAGRGAAGGEQ
jgi:hypothetical protein